MYEKSVFFVDEYADQILFSTVGFDEEILKIENNQIENWFWVNNKNEVQNCKNVLKRNLIKNVSE